MSSSTQADAGGVAAATAPPAVAAPPSGSTGDTSGSRLLGFFEAYALVGLLILAALFFSFYSKTSDTFPTSANLQVMIGNQTVVAIIALGALIPLTCNEWDLSVGATAGLSSIFGAAAMAAGAPLLVGIGLGIGLGVLVGLVNAVIVTRARVNAVITTLGMSTILDGVVNQKSGGLAVAGDIPASITNFGSGTWIGIPRTAFALAVVALLVYYALGHTPAGRYLYALGSNPKGARLVGLRTRLLLGSTFVAAGALAGAAGVLQIARSGGADPHVGESFTLPALAAAFLSAAAIKPGRYNVGGTLVAIFFLATLNSGLNLAGAATYVSSYVNGAALIIGVGLAANLSRKRTGQAS
jgi:ribose transport system permease protein